MVRLFWCGDCFQKNLKIGAPCAVFLQGSHAFYTQIYYTFARVNKKWLRYVLITAMSPFPFKTIAAATGCQGHRKSKIETWYAIRSMSLSLQMRRRGVSYKEDIREQPTSRNLSATATRVHQCTCPAAASRKYFPAFHTSPHLTSTHLTPDYVKI